MRIKDGVEKVIGNLWREQLDEVMAENGRLKKRMSEFETEVVDLLQRAHGSLSELSAKLIVLNGLKSDTPGSSAEQTDDDSDWYL